MQKRFVRMVSRETWVMGALVLAGAAMLVFALNETTAEEPPGWVAMNEQVEAVLVSQAKGEEQVKKQEKDKDKGNDQAVEKGDSNKADKGKDAKTVQEPQAVQAAPSE